jgi:hypothetical protein
MTLFIIAFGVFPCIWAVCNASPTTHFQKFRRVFRTAFLRQIYIPLLSLFFVSVVLHRYLNWGGFFINLATEIIGIIVTVAFVDWIAQKRESERWHEAMLRIRSRLKLFTNSSIRNLNDSIGISPADILKQVPFAEFRNADSIRRDVIWTQGIREIVLAETEARVVNLRERSWRNLGRALFHTYTEADKMLSLFGGRMKAEHYKLVLDIQEEARVAAIEFYQQFPEVIGAPENFLVEPKKKFSAVEKSAKEEVAIRTKNLLEQLLKLGEEIMSP